MIKVSMTSEDSPNEEVRADYDWIAKAFGGHVKVNACWIAVADHPFSQAEAQEAWRAAIDKDWDGDQELLGDPPLLQNWEDLDDWRRRKMKEQSK